MKIQYCSDLHLEFPHNREFIKNNPIVPVGDILILAGDILPFQLIDKHSEFLNYLEDNFEKTYWITGNHEYYGSDINERSGSFCESIRSNVYLINNQEVKLNDVNFLFSTLWSNIKEENRLIIENTLSDFKYISDGKSKLNTLKFNELHQNSLNFIEETLLKNQSQKNVVVSHHIPTFLNYPEEHRQSKVNQGFATELFDLIHDSSIDYWIYGHHHTNIPEFEINGTKLITNQLGYVKYKKNKSYRSDVCFEI
jgi:predicted phosphohydrolase